MGYPMQHLRTFVIAAVLAGSVASQVNPFVFFPQDPERQTVTCTSFVGRPDWNNAAEALWEINDQHIRGLGGGLISHGVRRIFGIYHWVADERLSTVETYDLVIRGADPTGSPDMTLAGEKLRIPGLTTPPSTNTGRGTWIMYDGFGLQGGWQENPDYPILFVGVGLPANPLWPLTDGHSLFRADMLNANTGALVGENHNASATPPTWAGTTSVPSFRTPWSYILGPFVTTPNLHVAGVDLTTNRLGAAGSNLGMGGLWPDVSGAPATGPRRDGLNLRIEDQLAPFGWAFFGASLGFIPTPYFHGSPMGNNLIGWCHIGTPQTVITLGAYMLQNGVREITIAMPGTIPTALVGTNLAFQGVVMDPNTGIGEWTNAEATHF